MRSSASRLLTAGCGKGAYAGACQGVGARTRFGRSSQRRPGRHSCRLLSVAACDGEEARCTLQIKLTYSGTRYGVTLRYGVTSQNLRIVNWVRFLRNGAPHQLAAARRRRRAWRPRTRSAASDTSPVVAELSPARRRQRGPPSVGVAARCERDRDHVDAGGAPVQRQAARGPGRHSDRRRREQHRARGRFAAKFTGRCAPFRSAPRRRRALPARCPRAASAPPTMRRKGSAHGGVRGRPLP